ncbi:MAG: hypothetical protein Unbinned4118contig1001_33 [Prokaryotic dsDNA virus sp.]|jgi:hypothetical protein|nr:MAG: hypothetical protein Unbinned4118contig1001_33 [Prokaryotic dsDNA virus sp.]|tara:strand:+ start:1672 stop:2241 length:570 start_codon:yes stop_codon:yes gene_type:complete
MLPEVLQEVKKRGHAIFERGAWNLNLIGVRTPTLQSNLFDDHLHCVFKDDCGQWVDISFQCTTDPGLYWLHNPMRSAGTAIMCPGQYRGAYKIGMHRKRYPALVQVKPVKVFRDRNRDEILDMDPKTITEGLYGVNIHHSGESGSENVNRWSAGCTVLSNLNDWEVFLSIVRRSADTYGDRFTYTLIEK